MSISKYSLQWVWFEFQFSIYFFVNDIVSQHDNDRLDTGFTWPLFQFLWFILFSQILESVDSLCEVTLGNPLDWKISVIFILRYIISFYGHFSTENIITALLKSHIVPCPFFQLCIWLNIHEPEYEWFIAKIVKKDILSGKQWQKKYATHIIMSMSSHHSVLITMCYYLCYVIFF